MNPKSIENEPVTVTASDMVEYFRTKFSAESKFRVYSTNAKGIVVTPTPETKLLKAAPEQPFDLACALDTLTTPDRDFLKAMKISIQHN